MWKDWQVTLLTGSAKRLTALVLGVVQQAAAGYPHVRLSTVCLDLVRPIMSAQRRMNPRNMIVLDTAFVSEFPVAVEWEFRLRGSRLEKRQIETLEPREKRRQMLFQRPAPARPR